MKTNFKKLTSDIFSEYKKNTKVREGVDMGVPMADSC